MAGQPERHDTTRVVNPSYREADGEVRKQAALLARKRCECNEIVLCDDIEPDKVLEYETRKQALQEEVGANPFCCTLNLLSYSLSLDWTLQKFSFIFVAYE
jgi:hypothetical protein